MLAEGKNRLRQTLGTFATGVTVITTYHHEASRQVGITVNSFSSVSLQPPMVLWSINRRSPNRDAFDVGSTHIIHVLRDDQTELARRFATPGPNKFHGLQIRQDPQTGIPLLLDWAAVMRCRTKELIAAGDHDIVLAEVLHHEHTDARPLIFVQGRFGAPLSSASNAG